MIASDFNKNSFYRHITVKAFILCALSILSFSGCSKKDSEHTSIISNASENKSTSATTKATTFKTMTYNIHRGISPSINKIDLQWIADVINNRNPKPDLVALQEVDVFTNRSGSTINQAKVLAEKTGMYFAFFRAMYYDGGEYGDAILSKYPIRQYYRYVLPANGGEGRSMGMIEVMIDNKPLNFAVTHLDHTSEATRLLQATEINRMVKDFRYPVILGGDFNATPTSSTVTKLKEQLTLGCNGGCPLTASAANPNVSIDHFFYKSTGFNRFDYYTITTQASDHLPLIATWTLK